MSDLRRRIHMSGLPPKAPTGISMSGGGGKRPMRKRDYTPVSWDQYFQQMHDVKVTDQDIFRVYTSGDSGPVVLFLHGGGFSALSWAVLSSRLCKSATCRCTAVDLRGHGDTTTADEEDLSAEVMSSDVGNIVRELYGEDPPPIILVGHSMGGAIAVHTARRDFIPSLVGLVVIDVVEGSALEALTSMNSFLSGRPPKFKSLEYAIEWSLKTGQIRNIESARVSMVGQLKRVDTNETATSVLEHTTSPTTGISSISEEDENGSETKESSSGSETKESNSEVFKQPSTSQTEPSQQYTWRIQLSNTEKYWRGWFEGLSQMFLSCPVPKMLMLANVDRLDKDLAVGQMQGKFQMQIIPQVGHAVHEDSPDKVSDVLATFLVRHKMAEAAADFHSIGVSYSSIGRSFPAC